MNRKKRKNKRFNGFPEVMVHPAGGQAMAAFKSEEKKRAIVDNDCIFCDEEHTEEYMKSMKYREKHNKWDDIQVIFDVLSLVKDHKWYWSRNWNCKYLDVRIDMRDGHGIIKDKEGNRISPKQLLYQYSKETPEKIKDEEAYKQN